MLESYFLESLKSCPAGSVNELLSVGLLSENVVRLSWPVQLTNFVLEYKPNLSSGTMWSSVTTTPSISGNERVVLETNAVAAKFYRLRK